MRYQIKQRAFSLADSYNITDDQGQPVFQVQGQVLSLGHALDLRDMQGTPLAHIQQRLLSWTATYEITRNGQPALTVQQEAFSFLHPRFDAEGPAGTFVMEGDWNNQNYRIKALAGAGAQISREWARMTDTYGIEIDEGADTPTLLCLAIVMDEVSHPDQQNR